MASWPQIARRIRVPLGFGFAVLYVWLAQPTSLSILAGGCLALPGLVMRGIASGLAFAQAGVLLHAALFRTVYLPWLPALLVPFWLLAGSFIAWWVGRAVLQPESIR